MAGTAMTSHSTLSKKLLRSIPMSIRLDELVRGVELTSGWCLCRRSIWRSLLVSPLPGWLLSKKVWP